MGDPIGLNWFRSIRLLFDFPENPVRAKYKIPGHYCDNGKGLQNQVAQGSVVQPTCHDSPVYPETNNVHEHKSWKNNGMAIGTDKGPLIMQHVVRALFDLRSKEIFFSDLKLCKSYN